ncbi:CSLREA domain-containing protein [Tautonia plasticadhaerens]|nr:CSLREA domain-containing protein [Tautonia plasticadhaerens]
MATFSVTSIADEVSDNGTTSLREAIALAASNPGDDLITFADGLSGTIALSLGELVLDDSSGLVEIRAGAGVSTIDAGGTSRGLSVRAGTTASLVGLTITGGRATDFDGGGGILNAGSLTLDGVAVSDNQAANSGGGLANRSGVLTMTDSVVSGNTAPFSGGGILNSGTMTVTGSTIGGNRTTSPYSGGGGLSNSGVLTLVGATVSGNAAASGAGLSSSGLLELRGSTVRDNAASRGGGGIIARYGTMALIDSTVSGNSAAWNGGGLYNYGGRITLTRSTVSGNSSMQRGGGLDNYYGGTITLDESTISGNSATTGGGLSSLGGRVTLTGSTVSGNVASDQGGGLAILYGTIRVVGSTLSGNRADSGGGLAHFGGDLELLNSTVSGNSATGDGGGLLNRRTLRLIHVTLTDNRADADGDGDGSGGGVFTEGSSSTQLVNSIISGNRRGSGETPDDLGGSPPAPGSAGNLAGSTAEGLDPTVNLVGIDDPRLGPLADNGGPTFTHALLPDSPAVDAAYILPGVTTDQRGQPRHLGGSPDVGAFEREGPPPGDREPGGLVVTTLDDVFNPFDFRTTLREAIVFASSRPGDDAITFDPALAGSISVLSALYGELTLADGSGAVAIDGRGVITLDARGAGRVLRVGQGTTATLSGLTITGGRVVGFGGGRGHPELRRVDGRRQHGRRELRRWGWRHLQRPDRDPGGAAELHRRQPGRLGWRHRQQQSELLRRLGRRGRHADRQHRQRQLGHVRRGRPERLHGAVDAD